MGRTLLRGGRPRARDHAAAAAVGTTNGKLLPADQKVGGGPSVLYDAVALVLAVDGAADLAAQPAAKDFLSDAHAHYKLIGHTEQAAGLLEAAGVADRIDDGYHVLTTRPSAKRFLEACRDLRWWERTGGA